MADAGDVARSIKKAVTQTVEKAAEAATAKLAELTRPDVPGAPAAAPSSVEEPTAPTEPLPPKPDQAAPDRRTPTGAATSVEATEVAQQGEYLTTAAGARLRDSDHSLKVGPRGPTLLQDHHLTSYEQWLAGADHTCERLLALIEESLGGLYDVFGGRNGDSPRPAGGHGLDRYAIRDSNPEPAELT